MGRAAGRGGVAGWRGGGCTRVVGAGLSRRCFGFSVLFRALEGVLSRRIHFGAENDRARLGSKSSLGEAADDPVTLHAFRFMVA